MKYQIYSINFIFFLQNLSKKGYRVIVHGRDNDRIEKACKSVNSQYPDYPAIPALADLSSIAGCEKLVSIVSSFLTNEFEKPMLNVVVHNAGVFAGKKKTVGENELEETFAVNVLAPFVLTSMLLPIWNSNIKKVASMIKGNSKYKNLNRRIVVASSISQSWDISNWEDVAFYNLQSFSSHKTYSESKLLVAMLTYELADRLKNMGSSYQDITINCLDPGTVNTKMLLAGWGPCGIEVEQALDETWLSTTADVENMTGKYFVGRVERKSSSFAYQKDERQKLWDLLSRLAPDAAMEWKQK